MEFTCRTYFTNADGDCGYCCCFLKRGNNIIHEADQSALWHRSHGYQGKNSVAIYIEEAINIPQAGQKLLRLPLGVENSIAIFYNYHTKGERKSILFSLMEVQYCLDGKPYIGYGIQCKEVCIPDITTNKSRLEKTIELCNQLDLSPIHIRDIVLDFLDDCY